MIIIYDTVSLPNGGGGNHEPSKTASIQNGNNVDKDITPLFKSGELSKVIADGSFKDINPGNYITEPITVDGVTCSKWVVGDCDYYFGLNGCNTHHLLMVADGFLENKWSMLPYNIRIISYIDSDMWKTTIPKVNTALEASAFKNHILEHTEKLSNKVDASVENDWGSKGKAISATDEQVKANLFNEMMIFGKLRRSSSNIYDVEEAKKQVALFKNDASKIQIVYFWWERAVSYASYSGFCHVSSDGRELSGDGIFSNALRPYFLLI